MTIAIPSFEKLIDYCEASGAIPTLFLRMEAENIIEVLEGKSKHIGHQELMDRLAKERRFPPYQEHNRGIFMKYTDYVGVHQERMYGLTTYLQDEFQRTGGTDIKKLLFGNRYHDAPEGVSVVGDIPTPIKENFNTQTRKIHDLYEKILMEIISSSTLNPKITGFSYDKMGELLNEFDKKETLTAQQNSYQDKFDACMVSIHEIGHDNTDFFLEKLKWYKSFFEEISQGIRLPLIKDFSDSIPSECSQLKEIYNSQRIAQTLGDIICAKDKEKRNLIIDNMPSYDTWKAATRTLENIQVGNEMMNGEQILIQER